MFFIIVVVGAVLLTMGAHAMLAFSTVITPYFAMVCILILIPMYLF